MTLRDYLLQTRQTYRDFARMVAATEHAVAHWARGARIPRRAMMARIEQATGGQVTAADFYAPATTPPARGAEQVAA
jgi:DNA-binding transcriptional regulator YdaS (Cro superfamily)